MADSSPREKDLFLQALELSVNERAAFVARACGADNALRQQVEAMLKAHSAPNSFLEKPAAALEGTLDLPPERQAGTMRVGPYKVLEPIGEGGMGVVYMAEQQQPVRRVVALKVIKPGMDSAQVIARFEAERQALALMDHPHIARVLDAGATADSRPYFVMELVKGIPITRYCDEHQLTPRERLALMVPVCQAVQHAHQKGIIHRDLKPSNVLVANYDGKPVPKVIDFGVAKAVGQPLTERTLVTGFGSVLGTLEYMSPEQAEFNALDVDTRSDIYSLGVLLYELLTGSTPLTRLRLKETALLEVLRLIREEECPRPSLRLSDSRKDLPALSAQRKLDPTKLTREIRGEVDWIVMKALEKDRGRRYETAAGLGRDIERYLREEAVEACPPSAAYRLKTFLRRNRRPVFAAALVVLALMAGIIGTSWGLVRARLAEGVALEQSERADGERKKAVAAEADARLDRDKARDAEAVAQKDRDRAIAAEKAAKNERDKAIAAEAAAKADRDKAEAAEADMQAFFHFVTFEVLATARPKGLHGGLGINVSVLEALEAADKVIHEAFEGRPRAEAMALHGIGVTWRTLSRYKEAEHDLRRAVAIRKQELGPKDEHTLYSLNSLGVTLSQDGREAEAIPVLEEALTGHREVIGEAESDTLICMDNLGVAYMGAGRFEDAVKLSEEVVALHKKHLGLKHKDTLIALNNLSVAYNRVGRRKEARDLKEQVMKASIEMHGNKHPSTVLVIGNLALDLLDEGRVADALPLLEHAYKASDEVLGPLHNDTMQRLHLLATTHYQAGAVDKATPLWHELLKARRKVYGPMHPILLPNLQDLAICHATLGQTAELAPLLKEYLELAKGQPDFEPLAANTQTVVGYMLVLKENFVEAEPLLKSSLETRRRVQPDDWTTFNTQSLLGGAHLGLGKHETAEPLLVEGYAGLRAKAALIPPPFRKLRLMEALERLVKLYEAWGKNDEAAKWKKELEEAGKG